jgi:hypothetical protein
MHNQRVVHIQLILALLCALWLGTAHAYNFASGSYNVGAISVDDLQIDISATTDPSVADFTPTLTIVKCNATQFARYNSTCTDSTQHMGATSASGSNVVQSCTVNGPVIGTADDAQLENSTCYYAVFGPDGVNNDIATGSYVGNGSTQTVDISDTSSPSVADFQADLIVLKSTTTAGVARWRSSAMTSTTSCYFTATDCDTNGITQITTNGFSVANNASVNSNTITYRYFAFRNLGTKLKVGTFKGDGNAGLEITDIGFMPKFGWVKANANSIGRMRFEAQNNTDAASPFSNLADVTGCITGLLSNGIVLGNETNCNPSGIDVYYFMITEMTSDRQRVRIVLP